MKEAIESPGCIPPSDVKKRQQEGEIIQIIDVRSPEEFAENHIPQAVNLPLGELEKSVPLLHQNALIVTACGKGGGRSAQGAELLRRLGFRSDWLCGGTFGWLDEK